jgi:alpha-1,3-mannosyltransferase
MPNSTLTIIQRCLHIARALLFDPTYFWALAGLVILGDAVLTGLIVRYVPCESASMFLRR